jgi:hypothetical protein
MQTNVTANEIRGRAIGALFFTFFGALWIGLALYAKQLITANNLTFAGLDFAVLLGMAIWLMGQARGFAEVAEDPARGRVFARINAIQWVAVAVIAFSFARLHLEAYLMNAIALIVGLHFFPLARLFHYKMHYATGACLSAWAAISPIFVGKEHLQGTTALGTGVLLWMSAFVTLSLAIGKVRRQGSRGRLPYRA